MICLKLEIYEGMSIVDVLKDARNQHTIVNKRKKEWAGDD